MKYVTFCVVSILFFSVSVFSQSGVSPNPVADNEVRDPGSIRMRSLQMERFKRDNYKARIPKTSEEIALKFKEIKDEFESIQKLQASIIKTYTTGKTIDYSKISHYSAELLKKAVKLNENLFVSNINEAENKLDKKEEKSKTVRELIILMDKSIGSFITSPIFSDNKLIDSNVSEKAGIDLEQIIKLSEMLFKEAKRLS